MSLERLGGAKTSSRTQKRLQAGAEPLADQTVEEEVDGVVGVEKEETQSLHPQLHGPWVV